MLHIGKISSVLVMVGVGLLSGASVWAQQPQHRPKMAGAAAGQMSPAAVLSAPAAAGGVTVAATSLAAAAPAESPRIAWPLITLVVGIAVVLGLIVVLKVNAFIALVTAAMVVSLMAPGDWAGKIGRVATAFGAAAGNIGIVIALAAVIGKCMLDSGAADRIVRAFLRLLGEKGAPVALMGSGFVLAVPVFFDTVFYLLVPLARSLYRTTRRNYLLYIMAIGAGGALTHTLVPPTPGPLMMASNLGFDVGMMIIVGTIVALPAAFVGVFCASLANRWMPVPMRQIGTEPEPEPLDDSQLPSLWLSLLPVVLPVILIATNTVLTTMADAEHAALLRPGDVRDWPGLREQIRAQAAVETPSPGKRIVEVLSQDSSEEGAARQAVLELINDPQPLDESKRQQLVDGLNRFILADKYFHREDQDDAFLGVWLNPTARSLTGKSRLRMKQAEVERLNRALLESAYPQWIAPHQWETPKRQLAGISALLGNANLALLISTVIALWLVVRQRGLSRSEVAHVVENSLMSGGIIILITAGGGAFGKMLETAQIGTAIQSLFGSGSGQSSQLVLLTLAFLLGSLMKIAQGSGTVAMIVGTSMMAAIIAPLQLGFHPVYLAASVGAGSLVCSWMNDSGFWIFAKMGGLTEIEALKSWTVMLIILGLVSFAVTVVLSLIMPLA